MRHRKHDTCQMHDRSRGMIRERARSRFIEEKKEMEHELSHHKTEVMKFLNDDFQYMSTSKYRGQYVVKFQHPDTHRMHRLTFHFEPNFKQLESMWTTPENH